MHYTEVGKINLNVEYVNDILKFKITDTGTGIKESDYNKLIELEKSLKKENQKALSTKWRIDYRIIKAKVGRLIYIPCKTSLYSM